VRKSYKELQKGTGSRDGTPFDKALGLPHFRPATSGASYPAAVPALYLHMSGYGGHVGSGSLTANNDADRCNIAGFTVPEDHIYSVTKSTLQSAKGTVRVFRHKFALENGIGSHICSVEASRRVTNGIPLRCPFFLLVHTVNCVQTRKAVARKGKLAGTVSVSRLESCPWLIPV
jgi:hypothetical protein